MGAFNTGFDSLNLHRPTLALWISPPPWCTSMQGLTLVHLSAQLERFLWDEGSLVHLSAQRKRFLWDRGSAEAVFEGYQGVLGGVLGVFLCQKGLRLS